MSQECLHKRLGGQVGLVLETHCKKGLGHRLLGFRDQEFRDLGV